MGRHSYVFLKRRHDVPITRRGDVPMRRFGDVPPRRRWVFHFIQRRRWDVQRDAVTTSPRRLLLGGWI